MPEIVVRNIAGEPYIQRVIAASEEEAKELAINLRKTSRRKIRVIGNGVYAGPSRSVRKA